MNTAAFILLLAMLTAYVMLDGYDLGVGAVHLFFSRSVAGRAASFDAIGPFWNGNEVFLIATGATLFALFPKAYAAAFSGFYLPFIIVLWLLMVRGMSIELRGHFPSEMWHAFWDAAFAVSSALLAFIFGVALGNILRGVPLDANGYFEGTFDFLLNPYALGVGLLSLAALALHGAAFLSMRAGEELRPNAMRLTRILWPFVAVLYLAITTATIVAHPIGAHAWLWIPPVIASIGLAVVALARSGAVALSGSSVFLVALMAGAAETLYPNLLPGIAGSAGLNIYNAAPGAYSVGTAFTAAVAGFGAVLVYGTIAAVRMLRRPSHGA